MRKSSRRSSAFTPATRTRSTKAGWKTGRTSSPRTAATAPPPPKTKTEALPLPVLYAEGRPMLRDRIQSLRHANIYEPQRYRHIMSSVLVEKLDDTHARSVANFMVIRIMESGDTLLFSCGRFV